MTGIPQLAVSEAVSALFGWQLNLTEEDLETILRDWTRRIESQGDYNALVGWLSLVLHREDLVPEVLRDDVWTLLAMRAKYPDVASERWDWSQLAKDFVDDHAFELGGLIVSLIDDHEAMIHESDDEANLLGQCAAKAPPIQKSFRRAIERHPQPIHQVDDSRSPVGHLLHRRPRRHGAGGQVGLG
jgi:hypothetical protein